MYRKIIALFLLVLSLPGCGGMQQAAHRAKKTNDMKQLVLAYHSFHDSNKRGPKDAEEWLKASKGDLQEQALIAQTRPGGPWVFYWNVNLGDLSKERPLGQTILGYEATAAGQGGIVAFADGTVQVMTAAEFAQAAKAEKPVK